MLADLDEFLRADSEERAKRDSAPVHVEMVFGMDDADPATIDLSDGRSLRVRGSVDRVDRRADGAPVVYDYKTGGASRFSGVKKDPVDHGRHVQLAVYGEAARQRYGADQGEGYYWFISRKGGYKPIGYVLDDARQERVQSALATIADGMAAGRFPARSGPHEWYWNSHQNCRFCPFDRLCPRDRHDEWEATSSVEELAPYRELAEGDYPPEPS